VAFEGKNFQRVSLVKHTATHNGHKPFKFVVCGKEFLENEIFVKYQRMPTGDKPFGCVICRKDFS
jgi:hypothetical protein